MYIVLKLNSIIDFLKKILYDYKDLKFVVGL